MLTLDERFGGVTVDFSHGDVDAFPPAVRYSPKIQANTI